MTRNEEAEGQQQDTGSAKLIAEFQELVKITPPEDLPRILAARETALKKENEQLEARIATDTLVESVFSHGHFLQFRPKGKVNICSCIGWNRQIH